MSVTEQVEVGFEIEGQFYTWSVSDNAKDLMLIDRFTGLPAHEFFEAVDNSFDRGRGPILLAMLATSVRARHTDWSVERIYRLISDISLSDISFIGGDAAEAEVIPPTEIGDQFDPSSEKSNGSPESTSKKRPKTQD